VGTSPVAGLTTEEAAERLAACGPNALEEAPLRHPLRILLGQFADFMVLLLAAAAVLAGLIGEPQDTIAIAAILALNAVLGFVQEHRAERALHALKTLTVPVARVRRGGASLNVAATELVPGDLVLLEAGNLVPADLRLVEASHLRIQEAALTGESHPVNKRQEPPSDPEVPIGDRLAMAYRGTLVVHGRGAGIVVAAGMDTELGRLAGLLAQERGVKTPLQLRLRRLGQNLALAALVIGAVILGLGLLRGEEPVLMLLTAVSLAVAAVPEALPAVVTLALALGARRMIRQQVLVRQLQAVETLGSVTYICADKTGTLTQNRMTVQAWSPEGAADRTEPWNSLVEAMALNNDARPDSSGKPVGDPLEVALYEAAVAAGRDPIEAARHRPRIGELPFSPERARMTTLHLLEGEKGFIGYTKGAPEQVISDCTGRLSPGGIEALDRDVVMARVNAMAEQGLRVIAFACRSFPALPAPPAPETVERQQTLIGLVGLLDPLRPEARSAVQECRSAGITVVMITGDHPLTARSIARELGILDHGEESLTGADLARLPLEELSHRAEGVRVYARVAPEQKIAIVRALQERGECVAMTGDGINDAPALRRADIGVAMGASGTDVAREAAHMVLLDDNFQSIVTAVRTGRRIYDNIRKFVRYVVTCNAAEVLTLLIAPLIRLPLPLLPIHLLWINLVTDGLPGLALAGEPAEPGLMRRPPRPPRESIFAGGMWQHVLWVGFLMAGITLATQALAFRSGSTHWQTMTFTVLALSQMGHVLSIRSEGESLFRIGLLTNPSLIGAVVLTIGMQLAIIYAPGLSTVFKTDPLTAGELGLCAALSGIVFVGVEIEKWLYRRLRPGFIPPSWVRGHSSTRP